MADKIVYKPNLTTTDGATNVPLLFIDQSDGTYAEKVVASLAAGTIEIGEVSIDQDVPGTTNGVAVNRFTGAANYANGQVTAGVASGVLVASRATRRSVVIRNQDTANSIYIGAGTVTSGNGLLLKAGESISIDSTAAINCIRATSDCAVGYLESFD